MRWSSVFAYLSAGVLVAAAVGKLAAWPDAAVGWLLLAWAVLLVPVALVLFRHPMRYPAWGLFLGFWGFLGVLTLIVLQSLAVADVLREPSRTFAEAWPLGVFGIWLATTSLLGLPDRVESDLAALITWLGALAGAALLTGAVVGIAGLHGASRATGLVSAAAYVLWAAALSGEIWGGAPGRARPWTPPTVPATSPPSGEETPVPAAATP